jgi:hypothetical protein
VTACLTAWPQSLLGQPRESPWSDRQSARHRNVPEKHNSITLPVLVLFFKKKKHYKSFGPKQGWISHRNHLRVPVLCRPYVEYVTVATWIKNPGQSS